MKKTFFVSLCFLLTHFSHAQIGLSFGARANDKYPQWQAYFPDEAAFYSQGYRIGIEYWFRLKKKRIEFTPELSYSNVYDYAEFILTLTNQSGKQFTTHFFSFAFNTNIYPFSFREDCNCSTFKKEGGFLKKGLFIQMTPIISYLRQEFYSIDQDRTINTSTFALGIGGGLGLDIGLSKIFTLTPMFNIYYYPRAKWEGLGLLAAEDGQAPPEEGDDTTSIKHSVWGLKLSIRFNARDK